MPGYSRSGAFASRWWARPWVREIPRPQGCRQDAPLQHQMQYMLHVGGGIQDVNGHHGDFGDGETHMGGQRIHQDMMNGSMMGQIGLDASRWDLWDGLFLHDVLAEFPAG